MPVQLSDRYQTQRRLSSKGRRPDTKNNNITNIFCGEIDLLEILISDIRVNLVRLNDSADINLRIYINSYKRI